MLYLLFSVFGWHIDLAKALIVVFAIGFFVVSGRYFASRTDPRIAFAIALLLSVSAHMAPNAVRILSDMPFCMLVWSALLIADRSQQWDLRTAVALTIVGILAILTRSAGVVLVPAMFVYWMLNFRHRRVAALAITGIWGVTFWVTAKLFPTVGSYTTFVDGGDSAFAIGAADSAALTTPPANVGERVVALVTSSVRHLVEYRYGVLESFLYPFPWSIANHLYHLVALTVMAIGLALWLRSSYRSLAASFALCYVGLLAVYPFMELRYLWPIAPVLVFGVLNGVAALIERSRLARDRELIGLVVLIGAIVASVPIAMTTARTPRQPSALEYPDVRSLYEYARAGKVREDQRWLVFNPRVMTLETGVPAMAPLNEDPLVSLREMARLRITHVAIGSPVPAGGDSAMRDLVTDRATFFSMEYRNSTFSVFRFLPPTETSPR
jgi:branched-subunit amino acid transport protein